MLYFPLNFGNLFELVIQNTGLFFIMSFLIFKTAFVMYWSFTMALCFHSILPHLTYFLSEKLFSSYFIDLMPHWVPSSFQYFLSDSCSKQFFIVYFLLDIWDKGSFFMFFNNLEICLKVFFYLPCAEESFTCDYTTDRIYALSLWPPQHICMLAEAPT